jgi:putative methyltransferase (TIGR04325 family)
MFTFANKTGSNLPQLNKGSWVRPGSKTREFGESLTEKQRLRALVKAVLETAPIRLLLDLGKPFSAYRAFLNGCLPSRIKFRGIYESFDEARANAPKGARLGYDHEEAAGIHEWQANTALDSDYPVLFWLTECLPGAPRLFDLGGNVGVSFYAWQNYLEFPDGLQWLVCDVPAVIERGRKLAVEKGDGRISFTSSFSDADGFGVLLTSGCLQLVEPPIATLLAGLKNLPENLLINRIPLNKSRSGVTLLNLGSVVSPYHVFNRDEFIAEVEDAGYRLIDIWSADDHCCWIPFYPEYSVEAFSGLYCRREKE